nr:single-stranded DNA-binding protein [uncultured Sphingobacterium sp.]
MQQIIGTVTANAVVKTLDSGKTVINFSIADNQTYTPKGASEPTTITTFFNCSYWLGEGVAKVLRKGATVLLSGRVSARAYTTNANDTGVSLDFHTNNIKVVHYAPKQDGNGKPSGKKATKKEEDKDDLPF